MPLRPLLATRSIKLFTWHAKKHEGYGAFLKRPAGGRRPFRDLSVGEAAGPPQAENAEGAKLPHGYVTEKTRQGGSERKKSPMTRRNVNNILLSLVIVPGQIDRFTVPVQDCFCDFLGEGGMTFREGSQISYGNLSADPSKSNMPRANNAVRRCPRTIQPDQSGGDCPKNSLVAK